MSKKMDNTSKQSDKEIINDKKEEVGHKDINREVEILQNDENKEIKEVASDDKTDGSKGVETPVKLEMIRRQKIPSSLFAMSNERMKEILKQIVNQHRTGESNIASQKPSSEMSQQVDDTGFVDKPAPQVSQELNVSCQKDEAIVASQKRSSESLQQLNDTGFVDNPALQVSQGLNVSCQKDESNNNEDGQTKELSNTRKILANMGKDELKERLRKIIKRFKEDNSITSQDESLKSTESWNDNYRPVAQPAPPANQKENSITIQPQSNKSSEQLNDNSSVDNTAPQEKQESNVSCQNDKTKVKQVPGKKSCSNKRLRNTRGTMYQMSSESMAEVRRIIKQHNSDDSILTSQQQSIKSSQQLNNESFEDKPAPQISQEPNVSDIKDEKVKKRSLNKRKHNTRVMNRDNMMELSKFVKQHQYSVSSLRKKFGVEIGSIDELNIARNIKVPSKTKPRKNKSIPQNTKSIREKPPTISPNELRQKELPLQNKYPVEVGFIKDLASDRKTLKKVSPKDNKDIQTEVNLKLTPYDECWIHSKETYQKVSKMPSLATIKEFNFDSTAVNVYDECWPQPTDIKSKVSHSYRFTLSTIVEETEDIQQISPPLDNFSKEDTVSLSNKVSIHQTASIREYLALPETCKDDLQSSDKLKKIFMSKSQWSKRQEKKKTKAEFQIFLELTKQQMDAAVLERESDEIWIDTQVKMKQNETDKFKHEIHKMVSRLETKLEENQQPLYLLRKEYEILTNKLANTKRWNIKRVRKLQQKLSVVSESLTKLNEANTSIMVKITEYDIQYVNKAFAM